MIKFGSSSVVSTAVSSLYGDEIKDIGQIPEQLHLPKEEAENFLKRAERPLVLDPNRYMYIRNRAVSSLEEFGPNNNHDAFPFGELNKWFHTFLYAGVFINHNNQNWDDRIGIVYDSAVRKSAHYDMFTPDGSGWVENILILDIPKTEAAFPGLITLISEGIVTDTSMGCLAEWSECSMCGKKIYALSDYCSCLQNKEYRLMVGSLPPTHYEIVHNLLFFEDSIITTGGKTNIVGGGADKNATILTKFASSPEFRHTRRSVEALIKKYASSKEIENKEFFSLYGNNVGLTQLGLKYLDVLEKEEIDHASATGSSSPRIHQVLKDIKRKEDSDITTAKKFINVVSMLLESSKERRASMEYTAFGGGTADEGESGSQTDLMYNVSPWSIFPRDKVDTNDAVKRLKMQPPETIQTLVFNPPFRLFGDAMKDFLTEDSKPVDTTPLVTNPPVAIPMEISVDDIPEELKETLVDPLNNVWIPEKWKKWLSK